jgi:hypothetical protein
MAKTFLTYGQKVILIFNFLRLNQIKWQKMQIKITLASQLGMPAKRFERSNVGLDHTDVSLSLKVPDLGIEETEILEYLTLALDLDGEIATRKLGPAVIMSNNRYFELGVATLLQEMYFKTVRYGGAKPDIVAYHIGHSTQAFDVEATSQSKYDFKKFGYDKAKFQRYSLQQNFKRLLLVTASSNVEKGVIDSLKITQDPITLITYEDLYYLYKELKAGRVNPDYVYSKLTETGLVGLSKPSFHKPTLIPTEKKTIWVELSTLFSKTLKDRKLNMVYIRDTTIEDVGKILAFAEENKDKYAGRQKFHKILLEHFKDKVGARALSLSTLHNPQNWDITFIHLELLDDCMRITQDGSELAHYWLKDRAKFKSRLAWLVLVRGNAVQLLDLLDEVQRKSAPQNASELKSILVKKMIEIGLCSTEGSGQKAIENTLRWLNRFDLITWDKNTKDYFIYRKKIRELVEKGDYSPKTAHVQ